MKKRVALDVEYTNYNKIFSPFSGDRLLTVAAYDGKNKYFWNISHPEKEPDELFSLHEIISNPNIELEGHHFKSDMLWIEVYLGNLSPVEDWTIKCSIFDTMNFADTYCLLDRETEVNSLEYLAMKFAKMKPWKEKVNRNKLDTESFEKVREYNIHDCIAIYNVATVFRSIKKEPDAERILAMQKITRRILIDMEKRGILVDPYKVYLAGKKVYGDLTELQEKVNIISGRSVYIESPKDLPKLLYEDLKLPVLMVSERTGNPSADTDAINELRYNINQRDGFNNTKEGKKLLTLLESITQYRKNAKLWSTFLKPIPKYIHYDGRIHCQFNLGKGYVDPKHERGTGTGRLSANNLNLQQQPALNFIRNNYIAKPNHKFLDADYSQLEIVITALVTQDENLIKILIEGKDVHTNTVAMIENEDYYKVEAILSNEKNKEYAEYKQKRWIRKRSGFGILYGMGPYHFTQLLKDEGIDVSMQQAKKWIEEWLDLYPSVRKARETSNQEAMKYGYVKTIFGHKIMTPYAKSQTDKQMMARNFRQAFNGKIQSPAAYVCLIAMVLANERFPNTLLLQVHDSLLFEPHIDLVTKMNSLLPHVMVTDTKQYIKDIFNVDFNVPLKIKIKESREWMA